MGIHLQGGEAHLSNIHVFSAKFALLGGDNQSEAVIKGLRLSLAEKPLILTAKEVTARQVGSFWGGGVLGRVIVMKDKAPCAKSRAAFVLFRRSGDNPKKSLTDTEKQTCWVFFSTDAGVGRSSRSRKIRPIP